MKAFLKQELVKHNYFINVLKFKMLAHKPKLNIF